MAVAKQDYGITDATGKRRVEIVRYGRKTDPDNLIVKPLLDAMVKMGMIRDDNPDWIELDVSQGKARESPTGKAGTQITIKAVNR